MPLKSKLKNSCCPSTNTRMNRAICMIPELARICWKTFPVLWKNLLKGLTGDCGVLISEWADLQKRWTVALLHYSCLFQVRNNEKMIIFKQNLAKKCLVLNIKNINIITSNTHKTKINEILIWSIIKIRTMYYCNNIKRII